MPCQHAYALASPRPCRPSALPERIPPPLGRCRGTLGANRQASIIPSFFRGGLHDHRHEALPDRCRHPRIPPLVRERIPGRLPLVGDGYMCLDLGLLADVIDVHGWTFRWGSPCDDASVTTGIGPRRVVEGVVAFVSVSLLQQALCQSGLVPVVWQSRHAAERQATRTTVRCRFPLVTRLLIMRGTATRRAWRRHGPAPRYPRPPSSKAGPLVVVDPRRRRCHRETPCRQRRARNEALWTSHAGRGRGVQRAAHGHASVKRTRVAPHTGVPSQGAGIRMSPPPYEEVTSHTMKSRGGWYRNCPEQWVRPPGSRVVALWTPREGEQSCVQTCASVM
jgi:hypothetical protein